MGKSTISMAIYYIWLVVSTPLKNISQLDDYSQYMEKYKMFQTTNQIYIPMILPCSDNPHESPQSVDHLSAKAFCGCEAKPDTCGLRSLFKGRDFDHQAMAMFNLKFIQ